MVEIGRFLIKRGFCYFRFVTFFSDTNFETTMYPVLLRDIEVSNEWLVGKLDLKTDMDNERVCCIQMRRYFNIERSCHCSGA